MTQRATGRVLTQRARIVLLAVGLLRALDVGRSLWARVGYARPVEVWQPEARVYADLTWPPGSDLPADASLGRRIYAHRCAVCHGPDGRGNGPAAPSLIPRPVDFVRGQFKYKSTPGDHPPTDEDLLRVVYFRWLVARRGTRVAVWRGPASTRISMSAANISCTPRCADSVTR